MYREYFWGTFGKCSKILPNDPSGFHDLLSKSRTIPSSQQVPVKASIVGESAKDRNGALDPTPKQVPASKKAHEEVASFATSKKESRKEMKSPDKLSHNERIKAWAERALEEIEEDEEEVVKKDESTQALSTGKVTIVNEPANYPNEAREMKKEVPAPKKAAEKVNPLSSSKKEKRNEKRSNGKPSKEPEVKEAHAAEVESKKRDAEEEEANVAEVEPKTRDAFLQPALSRCKKCFRDFKSPANLYHHERICVFQRYFECNHCERNFERKSHLDVHVRSAHTKERPYECPVPDCESAFTDKSNLRRHLNLVHKK